MKDTKHNTLAFLIDSAYGDKLMELRRLTAQLAGLEEQLFELQSELTMFPEEPYRMPYQALADVAADLASVVRIPDLLLAEDENDQGEAEVWTADGVTYHLNDDSDSISKADADWR